MSKYLLAINSLEKTGKCKITVFGQSMMPIIKSGSTLEFEKRDEYEVGDIVFCKIKGRYVDAHKIIKKNLQKGYLIANNQGRENGWTKKVYGKVVRIN
jgi:SOS-response transcriptional repressor LexA